MLSTLAKAEELEMFDRLHSLAAESTLCTAPQAVLNNHHSPFLCARRLGEHVTEEPGWEKKGMHNYFPAKARAQIFMGLCLSDFASCTYQTVLDVRTQ